MVPITKMAGLLLLAMLAAHAASAQTDYPNNPVRLLSDSGPGSAADAGLRIVADGMGRYWKQQVVIVNQPGAAGSVSATVASQAAPDGHTLYAPTLSLFLAVPGKAPKLPLMVPRDFAAVGFAFEQLLAIAVSPKLGIKTLQELIDLARKKPGELSYVVTGAGRLTHLTGELLQLRTGIKLQMVPYSGNSAQAITDVYAGRIPLIIDGYTGLVPAFQSGALVPLAVGAARRLPSAPDLPTIAETGVGTERHAGADHRQGERSSARGARNGRRQGAARGPWIVRPPDVAGRVDGVHSRPADIVETGDQTDRAGNEEVSERARYREPACRP